MKYEVIYRCANFTVVEAENETNILSQADRYDSDKAEYIDAPSKSKHILSKIERRIAK